VSFSISVAVSRTIRAALTEVRDGALSAHVIEWAGERVASLKKEIKSAARAAGIKTISVSPHIFRHSAAVHMAEAGLSMEVIAQYLGHEDVNVTRKVYARFSPTYLKQAASVLEYDDLRTSRFNEPEEHYSNPMQVIEKMVEDAVGCEPVSASKFPANREINREFRRIRPLDAILNADT